jgi:Uma2 family endonuclease
MLFLLVQALKVFAARQGGKATMAPFSIRLWEEKSRQPDGVFMRKENLHRCHPKFWDGADVAMEVLSESTRDLDLEVKREEYAKAGIPEYWIIDRENREITVLTLRGGQYAVHGRFAEGQRADSATLAGFEVAVSDVLAAE